MVNFIKFENDLHKNSDKDKGKIFENYTKWYLENSPLYNFKKVWLWENWSEKNSRDIGIDLVAENEQGVWAIQSKAYDKNIASKKQI